MTTRRRRTAALLGAGLLGLLLTGCGAGDNDSPGPKTAVGAAKPKPLVTASPSPRPNAAPLTSTVPPTSSAPAAALPDGGVDRTDLADGWHAARVTEVDPTSRMVTVDVVQLFQNADAAREAEADDMSEEDISMLNDLYVRNENTRLRTLPVAPGATVSLTVLAGVTNPQPVTLEELAGYGERLPESTAFRFELRNGKVSSLTEVFTA